MEEKIVLKVHNAAPITVDRVRIDQTALAILQSIQRETGLPARYIVSELIKQGARFIEVKEI
ncbi:MAG: hypothetical protein RSD23_07620 [Ruthenibacterium sp.]